MPSLKPSDSFFQFLSASGSESLRPRLAVGILRAFAAMCYHERGVPLMPEERCPLCLQNKLYQLEDVSYYKFQNTERLVCEECGLEVLHMLRPTWQIIAGRIFPKSTKH